MTYDAKQMAAVLTACLTCGRRFYMTVVQPTCVLCRRITGLVSTRKDLP